VNDEPELLLSLDGPLATITLNRPHAHNALTWKMYDALIEACDTVDATEAIRVVLIRGAGGKAFAAGTDISQFQNFHTEEDALNYERRLDQVIGRVEAVTKPTIAVIQGVAAGAGALLAVACDLRYCTPDSLIGAPIARTLGNCLSIANYARIVDLVGPARTKELIFRAHLATAEEAVQAGLVNAVVAPAQLDEHVKHVALEIAGHAPITLRVTKEAICRLQVHRRAVDGDDLTVQAYMSEDFREGVKSFMEKRRAVFRGR
jgi:enoyl-CoA hydratase/carnithine racemase